jgi:hypothetical protein
MKGSPGPCDHEVMGSSAGNKPLAEMQGKDAYIRPNVVGPFPRPCISESYVHRAALHVFIITVPPTVAPYKNTKRDPCTMILEIKCKNIVMR